MITNEIKAKVFAPYLGQKFKWAEDDETTFELAAINYSGLIFDIEAADDNGEGCFSIDECKLILKPISAISDEHAIQIFDMFFKEHHGHKSNEFKLNISKSWLHFYLLNKDGFKPKNYITGYQFLQNQGYDLPHFLLDNKTLQQSGLAIYQ